MESTMIYLIAACLVLVALLTGIAYALGRYSGRQEQVVKQLKQEHARHRAGVLRRQAEMEEDWTDEGSYPQMPPVAIPLHKGVTNVRPIPPPSHVRRG